MSVIHPSQLPETKPERVDTRIGRYSKECVREQVNRSLVAERHRLEIAASEYVMKMVRAVDVAGACTFTRCRDAEGRALEHGHRITRLLQLLTKLDYLQMDNATEYYFEHGNIMKMCTEDFIDWMKAKETLDASQMAAILSVVSRVQSVVNPGASFSEESILEWFQMPPRQRREAYARIFDYHEGMQRLRRRTEEVDIDAEAHANFDRRQMRALYASGFSSSCTRNEKVDKALEGLGVFTEAQRQRMETNIEADENRMLVERRARWSGSSIDSDKGL